MIHYRGLSAGKEQGRAGNAKVCIRLFEGQLG